MNTPAPIGRLAVAVVAALVLLTGAGPGVAIPAKAQGTAATPVAAASDPGSLAAMLARLPDAPLGQGGASVTYVDIAQQTGELGFAAAPAPADAAERQRWVAALSQLALPLATGQFWSDPAWRETFGFELFQVEQAAEFTAPPLGITVLRGMFDPAELRAAWARGGYQPIDLGAGEAYAVREDFALDLADPGGRMAMAYLNVVALADDGTLVLGSAQDAVRAALAASSGQAPSLAESPDVAPLVRAAPPDLVSALLLPGEALRATPDPAGALLGEESPPDVATRVAVEQAEARRLSPISAALLGQTAGVSATGAEAGTPTPHQPPARLVVALTAMSPETAAEAATVIEDRLATGRTPASLGGDLGDRSWGDLYPERTVHAVPNEPAVLIELMPAPGVQPLLLQNLLFQRMPGFLAWDF